MASEALKQFMIERLLDLDPSLSEDEGSLMFIKVVDPLLKRLGTDPLSTDIETFILDRLADDFPDLDVNSPGSVLRDLLVSPLVLLLEPIRREIEYLRLQRSLDEADAMAEEELDALLTNVFAYRLTGEYSRAIQRIFFSSPRTVGLDGSIVFSTGDGVGYVPEDSQTYLSHDLKRSGTLYYLDVAIRSVQPTTDGNVAKGAIRFVSGLDGVVRTTNTSAATGGVTAETNESYVERAERSLSERSLNTKRGIETDLFNNFSELVSVDVVGYGETDMQRDILQGEAVAPTLEVTGPLIFATNLFRTVEVGSINIVLHLPFTNTVVLYAVPDAKVAAITTAKYIRVVDGNGWYDDLALSRVREIRDTATVVSIAGVGFTDITVRVKDFVIYPDGAPGTTSSSQTILTKDVYHGYNKYARGGSAQKLYVDSAGTDYILGAPLPITDYIDGTALVSTPTGVIPGRDYLAVTNKIDSYLNDAYAGGGRKLTEALRVYPLDAWYSGNQLGVARTDAHMVSKRRIAFPGTASYVYDSDKSLSMLQEKITVIDYGGPAYSEAWTQSATLGASVQTRYDGSTLESYSKNPGVALYGASADGTTFEGDPTTTAKSMWVVLEGSQSDWASKGVVPGHHIALSLYDPTGFTGEVSLGITKLEWLSWGRVDSYHATKPNWLLVKGLDWTSVDTNKHRGFSGVGLASTAGLDGRFEQVWSKLDDSTGTEQFTASSVVVGTEMQVTLTPTVDIASFKPGDVNGGALAGFTLGGIYVKDKTTNNVPYYDNGSGVFRLDPTGSPPDLNAANCSINYTTGVVVLAYAGVVNHPGTPDDSASYEYAFVAQDQYRASWTVYEGELESVAPDGTSHMSYAELVFAPANPAYAIAGDCASLGPSFYQTEPGGGNSGLYSPSTYGSANAPYHTTSTNQVEAHWIRLDKDFSTTHPSLGKTPIEANQSAEVFDLDTTEAPLAVDVEQTRYLPVRFSPNTTTLAVRTATTHEIVRVPTSLPVQSGVQSIGVPTAVTPTLAFNDQEVNSHRVNGFLIPHPMGGVYDDTAAPYNTTGAAEGWFDTDWDANLNFDQQLVQVYDGVVVTTDPAGINVSGMPGSTPFPKFFEGTLAVDDNKIHIGGLTDVYVKGSSVTEETTGVVTLSPDKIAPLSVTETIEVVASGSDGSWVSGASVFTSPTLLAALNTEFTIGAGAFVALNNYVVELIEPPTVTPTSFRVLLNSAGGAIIDGSFSTGPFAGVSWRLLRTCTTSLENPVSVLQQGTSLETAANDFAAKFTVTFTTDPTVTSVYLEIQSGDDRGEYQILAKAGSSVTLDTSMTTSATGLSYRVYTKQNTAAILPLVRVKEVSLTGDNAGVLVPYKHPVDAVASSFSALNDDPLSDTHASVNVTGHLENFLVGGVTTTYFYVIGGAAPNFTTLGVLNYDVLRIENQADPLKYWYVTGIDSYLTGVDNRLKLDRLEASVPTSSSIDSLEFSLGHPSVGTAKLYFLNKTYYELGSAGYLSYKDTTGADVKFRPSPAETSTVYHSAQVTSAITVGPTTLDQFTFATSVNPYAHGLAVGDTIEILTRMVESASFNTTEKDNINVSGKTLMLDIDGTITPVVFSGTNPRTIDDVATDINAAVGSTVKAVVSGGASWELQLHSRTPVEVVDQGTVGILTLLKFPAAVNRDNTPSGLVGTYQLKTITYDPVAKTTLVALATPADVTVAKFMTGVVSGDSLFIKVTRALVQRLYPSDLLTDDTGLYYGEVKLTSYDPFVADTVLTGQQMSSTGHDSFGYELSVDNNNYSYSMGEKAFITTSPVCLADTATDLTTVYALPGAGVTITYEYSGLTEDVQNYLLNPHVRVVNNNPLARHFLPAYPAFSVKYQGSMSEEAVKAKLEEFFTTLYPNKELEVYDLTTVLSLQGLSFVQFPQEVAFIYHDEDRVIRVLRSTNKMALGKKYHIMEDTSQLDVSKVG